MESIGLESIGVLEDLAREMYPRGDGVRKYFRAATLTPEAFRERLRKLIARAEADETE